MSIYGKIIDGKFEEAPVNFKTENGIIINFNLNKKMMKKYGYKAFTEQEIQELNPVVEVPIQALKFSKLKVKNALSDLGLWVEVKNTMTEEEYEDFMIAQDLSFDNEAFVKFYNLLKLQVSNIDDVLRGCAI